MSALQQEVDGAKQRMYLSPSEYSPRFGSHVYTVEVQAVTSTTPPTPQLPLPGYKKPWSQTLSQMVNKSYPITLYSFSLQYPKKPAGSLIVRRFSEVVHLWRHLNIKFTGKANLSNLYKIVNAERAIHAGLDYDSDDEDRPGAKEVGCFSGLDGSAGEKVVYVRLIVDHLLSGKFTEAAEGLSDRIYKDELVKVFLNLVQ